MSIKSEIRLITQIEVPIDNGGFRNDDTGWVGTGTTSWTHSNHTNSLRSVSGNTTILEQVLQVSATTVADEYFPFSTVHRLDYQIYYDNDPLTSVTPIFGGFSGTTRTENGTYFDLFYSADIDDYNIYVTEPDCSVVLQTGSTYDITWVFKYTDDVKIELYSGSTFIETITGSTSLTTFPWEVGDYQGTYNVLVTSNNVVVASGVSCDFIISNINTIIVSEPDCTEILYTGYSYNINWSEYTGFESFDAKIDLYTGSTFILEITGSTNDKSYNWTVDDTPNNTNYNIVVTANDIVSSGQSCSFEIKDVGITGDDLVEIDTLTHSDPGQFNSLVQIDSTHSILAMAGTNVDGYIKTFSMDSTGGTITEIDSLEHDTVDDLANSMVKIDDTHYMLAYTSTSSDGYIKTFSIDSTGGTIAEIDSLLHDSSTSTLPSLTKIDTNLYMLAYTGNLSIGVIKTFTIDGSYNISQADSLTHDSGSAFYSSLVKVDTTHSMLAYAVGNSGYTKTFSMDSTGGTIALTNVLIHEPTLRCNYNSLIQLSSNTYILAFEDDANNKGYIKTFSLSGVYNVITEIDSLEHESTLNTNNSMVKIDDTHCMLAYRGPDDDGYVKSFSTDSSTDNITQIDSLEHDTTNNEYNSIVKMNDTKYMLAYSNLDVGIISTFKITVYP